MALDTTIHNATLAHPSHTKDNIANIVSNLGLIVPLAGHATSYILGEFFHDQRAKERAADGAEAALLSMGMLTYPTKFLLGRERPKANQGAFAYNPFYAGGSLPSFHAVDAFTAAAVATEYWDNPWASAAAYGFAAAVGWARIMVTLHQPRHRQTVVD